MRGAVTEIEARGSTRMSSMLTSLRRTSAGGERRSVAQAVAGAAHRLELRDAERTVDLVAQVADVDVDDVRAVLVVVVPGVLEQLVAREHLARVAHEGLQELELLRRQRHLGVAAPHAAGGGIQAKVADLEHRGALDGAAAGQR